MWEGLGKGTKIALSAFLVIAILGTAFVVHSNTANAYVPLYTTKLNDEDTKAVAMELTSLGIPHNVDLLDGILVSPKTKARAQVALAAKGLPRHAITTPYNTPEGGIQAKTQAEQKALRQRMLEGELTETVRQVEGVADAYIKLAIPEQTYFRDDSRPTTATVLVKLEPSAKLTREQIAGIVHLVSFSVPELLPEHVKIVDTMGMDLTAQLPQGPDGAQVAGTQQETQLGIEKELTQKVQDQLDKVLGPGKAVATVNAELDFSQNEVTRSVVGGPADQGTVVVGRQKKVESYSKDPNAGGSSNARQLSTDVEQASSGGTSNNNYVHEVESVKIDTSKTVSRTVDKSYRVKRKTASVVVDNLKEDQVAKIAGIVRNAIGIDEARGDSVVVESMPIYRPAVGGTDLAITPPPGFGETAGGGGLTARHLTIAGTAVALVFLGLILTFMVKQHSVQVNQGKLVLGGTSGATSTDIADLLNEKSGKSTAPPSAGETKVNTNEQLEQLAKERPTKVAEMLKSTWLS
ncbi:MAG: flagellar basal-body MS-ring/collar protein FliF [Vulcanimicrobiota bacterium]